MSRKTQIGWIAVGALLCLVSLALTLKLRDGDKAIAREDDTKPSDIQVPKDEKPPSSTPFLPPMSKPSSDEPSHFSKPVMGLPAPLPVPEPKMDPKTGRVIGDSMPPPGGIAPPPLDPYDKPPPPSPLGSDNKFPPPPSFGEKPPMPPIKVMPPSDVVKSTPPPLPDGSDKMPLPPPANIDKAPPVPAVPIDVKPLEKTPLPPPTTGQLEKPLPPPITGQPLPGISSPENPKIPAPATPPNWTRAPQPEAKEVVPVVAVKQEPGEPPLVAPSGPVQIYHVRGKTETLPDIARRTLGSSDRCNDILRLNPTLKADSVMTLGMTLRLPPDACLPDEADAVKPLPALRPKDPEKAKVLPLTGTYPCTLDEHKVLTLPKAIRDQLDNCDTVLVSPGPDHCLWLTNHAHLERLADRIEHSPAREADVRIFKRLYYAQTEKTSVTSDGRITISDKLAQFAGLSQEMVLVGIDEHFELWDATRWKQYTQQKSAAARAAADE